MVFNARNPIPGETAVPPDAPTCFVMSPFGGDHDDYHREIFVPAIESAGLRPTRADDLYMPSPIVADIWHMIRECQLGLADVTGRNANVLYELGLAHAITKPVVLVTRSLDDVPFDLRGLRVVSYNVNKVNWAQRLQSDITNAIREVLEEPERCIPLPFIEQRPSRSTVAISDQERSALALEQKIDAMAAQLAQFGRSETTTIAWNAEEPAEFIAERKYNNGAHVMIHRLPTGMKRVSVKIRGQRYARLPDVPKIAQAQVLADRFTEENGADLRGSEGWVIHSRPPGETVIVRSETEE